MSVALTSDQRCVYAHHTRFDYLLDPAKSASNLDKHGIDFAAVQAIWQDVMRMEIPARTEDEPRWLVVGQIDGKHWSVVVTYARIGSGSSPRAGPGRRRWRL